MVYNCPMFEENFGYSLGIGLSWITYLLAIGLIIATIYWLIKSANRKR